jgi:hypothetical protein
MVNPHDFLKNQIDVLRRGAAPVHQHKHRPRAGKRRPSPEHTLSFMNPHWGNW